MKFNEDTRVKIPAILHLARLGYGYLSLKSIEWNKANNIVPPALSQCTVISPKNPDSPFQPLPAMFEKSEGTHAEARRARRKRP